jgi:predicted negative regulator of RcsB-dependent stress response
MDADVTQSKAFLTLWAWADKNKKQLMWGLIGLAVVALGVAFWLAHQSESQNDANDALSKLVSPANMPGGTQPAADSLLKIAADYSGTEAGQRALLMAAGNLFATGKYDDAQGQFQKFIKDYNDSKLISQAAIGVAACYDAQGKTNDAIAGYQSVVDRYPNDDLIPQAKLALGRLLEAQGKFKEAKINLEDVYHNYPGTTEYSEAVMRLQQLLKAHPELQSTNTPTAPPPGVIATPAAVPPANSEKH